MKPYLEALLRPARSVNEARNHVRDYLQARILECLQRRGAMIPLAFQGGAALRLLYGLRRFSEDLDFTLEQARERYDLGLYLREISTTFESEGYSVDVKLNDKRVVHGALVRFPGLLHELGLSPHLSAVFSIRIEIDTNPPKGAVLETTVVRKHVIIQIQHHDRASLLAGKLHALLQRRYTKGRDLYDLLWYLSDRSWPEPNLVLLNNALLQTGFKEGRLTSRTWRRTVQEHVRRLDWRKVAADVLPFLENPEEARLIASETILPLLK